MNHYIPRLQEQKILSHLKQFSVVCLTGPRQVGKSTLLKHLQKPSWQYLNLDERGLLERALRDPDLFIENLTTPIIIDEAQKAPPIFHSIKAEVDKNPKKCFILSGSANFQLMETITETLAGRASIVELLPFSMAELSGIEKPRFISNLLQATSIGQLKTLANEIKIRRVPHPYRYILSGGMPKVHELKTQAARTTWFENYRTTYIERDLRNLAQVGHLEDFQRFYQSIAFQTGNLLNLSNFSQEIGISVPTCKRYLDILRTSYQAFTQLPYYTNIKKRFVKTPKCYLLDTGIACFFLRCESEEMLKNSGHLGALFETWIVNELKKITATLPVCPTLSFWQLHAGYEVDIVLEMGETLVPMEVKHAIRLQDRDIKGLQLFINEIKNRNIPFGILWYRGATIQQLGEKIIALPIEYLWN